MIRQFFRDSAIYTIPSILSYGISFFLIPLYTRLLSPSDYGALDMITIFGSLVAFLVALEISQAVARYYLDEKTEEGKKNLASTALWFTVFTFTAFLIVALLITPQLSPIVIGAQGFDNVFRLGIVFIWVNGLLYLVKNQMRFEMDSKAYSLVSIVHSLTTAAFSVIFAYFLQLGIIGIMAGMITGTAIGTALGFYYLKRTFQASFNILKLKTMLAFSIPIVPSSIAVFVSMYIDRLMINYFLSLEEVGLYGVGYRIASVSTLILIGFQMALTPLVYKHYQDPDTPNQLATIFRIFIAVILIIFLGLTLFADLALWILTTPAYYAASQVVVFLVPAILLSQMYIFAPGIGIAKKTHIFIWINVGGAIINAIFNWILIPEFGYVGAGIATLIGYTCVFGAHMYYSQNLYYIPHNWRSIAGAVLVAVVAVAIGSYIHTGMFTDILIKAGLILMMPIAFLYFGIIKREEIAQIREILPVLCGKQ